MDQVHQCALFQRPLCYAVYRQTDPFFFYQCGLLLLLLNGIVMLLLMHGNIPFREFREVEYRTKRVCPNWNIIRFPPMKCRYLHSQSVSEWGGGWDNFALLRPSCEVFNGSIIDIKLIYTYNLPLIFYEQGISSSKFSTNTTVTLNAAIFSWQTAEQKCW